MSSVPPPRVTPPPAAPPTPDPPPKRDREVPWPLWTAPAAVLTGLVVGVFGSFIFGALRRWHVVDGGHALGTWVAAVITGILFGLAHTGSAASQCLIPLGFLGFVLCLVRWRTGSLYPCMALHAINNSLAL